MRTLLNPLLMLGLIGGFVSFILWNAKVPYWDITGCSSAILTVLVFLATCIVKPEQYDWVSGKSERNSILWFIFYAVAIAGFYVSTTNAESSAFLDPRISIGFRAVWCIIGLFIFSTFAVSYLKGSKS